MKLINKQPKQLAFSIIELLVAMAIFAMIAATGVIAVLHSLAMTRMASERNQAVLLLDEGLDALRSIKRQAWINLDSVDCSLGCGLSTNAGVWALTATPELIDGYTRTVFIKNAQRDVSGLVVDSPGQEDQNLKEVKVTIDWNLNGLRDNSISSKTYLAHYEQPLTVQNGLLAHWPFDEGTGNLTSSANNLTANIYGASWTTGISGMALDYDGNNDYVKLDDAESLIADGQLSIVAWVNPSAFRGNQTYVYVMKGTTGTYNYQFGHRGRRLYFTLGDAVGSFVTSGNTISRNDWQQVAVTVDGLVVKFYRNGQLIATENLGIEMLPVTGSLFFGSELGQSNFFEGIIDEVEIYNRPLTDQEILDKYN